MEQITSQLSLLSGVQKCAPLLVCVIAMQTVLSAVTNAASTTYQKKVFENSMSVNTENVLHLHYQYNEESQEFAETLKQYIDYIENIPGVEAVGQFDMMGMYFSELKTMEEYQEVNKKFVQGTKLLKYSMTWLTKL